jgi:transposase InsO family protein
MSTQEKVAMVNEALPDFGLPVALNAFELARSTFYYHQKHVCAYEEKHSGLRKTLEEIARKHCEYGYRRTTTELKETYGQTVNKKVVQRLHGLWGLPLLRTITPPKPSAVRAAIEEIGSRANLVAGLTGIGPFEVCYTDFSEIVYAGGKAQLIPLIDHDTKVVLGWALGERATTALSLDAWKKAKAALAALGYPLAGLIVHHDRDSVFTSYRWLDMLLRADKCRVSYALNGPGDNPEMESFFGRFKTENRSLFQDAQTLEELREIVGKRIRYYNQERRHSTLGNQIPLVYAKSLNLDK